MEINENYRLHQGASGGEIPSLKTHCPPATEECVASVRFDLHSRREAATSHVRNGELRSKNTRPAFKGREL
ncbi:MAG: hypothetical protein OCU16_05645 [Candidatus Methanospirare jalkutatii]|nr:hypothetical protein [Candidatus Methanospirare jalkutatii]